MLSTLGNNDIILGKVTITMNTDIKHGMYLSEGNVLYEWVKYKKAEDKRLAVYCRIDWQMMMGRWVWHNLL